MWLKRLSAHPDLPVLYSSLGFSTLWMLLTAKKGLHVDIGDFHVYITMSEISICCQEQSYFSLI